MGESDRRPRLAIAEIRRDVDRQGVRWAWFRFTGSDANGLEVLELVSVRYTGDTARDQAEAWKRLHDEKPRLAGPEGKGVPTIL